MRLIYWHAGGLAVAAMIVASGLVIAGGWPEFYGPDRSGVAAEGPELARSWPDGGPPVLWAVEVGRGYAGVAVVNGEVFLLDREDNERDVLRCLDLETGEQRWSHGYDAPGMTGFPGSRSVPTVTGRFVVTLGPFGHLTCVSRKSHKPVWSVHLPTAFVGCGVPRWGYAQHPIVHDGNVIVAPHGKGVGVAAFNLKTGKLAWTSPSIGPNLFCYATPTLATIDGVDQLITLSNEHLRAKPKAIIHGIDAKTGEVLWQTDTATRLNVPIPQPLPLDGGRFLVTGGYDVGLRVFEVSRPGPSATQPWRTPEHRPWNARLVTANDHLNAHLHRPIRFGDHVYANSHDRHQRGANRGLICLTPGGELIWQSGPDVNFDNGGLLIADGLIYILHGDTGTLHLVEATPQDFRPLASAKVLDARGGEAWAPLAIADGRLLVRDLTTLKCLDVRAAAAPPTTRP